MTMASDSNSKCQMSHVLGNENSGVRLCV